MLKREESEREVIMARFETLSWHIPRMGRGKPRYTWI